MYLAEITCTVHWASRLTTRFLLTVTGSCHWLYRYAASSRQTACLLERHTNARTLDHWYRCGDLAGMSNSITPWLLLLGQSAQSPLYLSCLHVTKKVETHVILGCLQQLVNHTIYETEAIVPKGSSIILFAFNKKKDTFCRHGIAISVIAPRIKHQK